MVVIWDLIRLIDPTYLDPIMQMNVTVESSWLISSVEFEWPFPFAN